MNRSEYDQSGPNFFNSLDSVEEDSSVKRRNIEALKDEDLISGLPDSIIVDILSLLPSLEEVIRTGILSKRWKYLWTSIPVLDFSNDKKRPLPELALFIDNTLDQRRHSKLKNPKLKKLKVEFEVVCEPAFASQLNRCMNRCIRHAVDCNVEELDISFFFDGNLSFELPKYVFANDSFIDLVFRHCIFVPNGLISWKGLKTLTIWNSKLSEDLIENMISGSPGLEFLELSFCYGFNRLNITSSSVKELILSRYFEPSEDNSDLEIHAPNLLSLGIGGDLSLWKLMLFSVPSLIKATLDFSLFDENADKNMLQDLLLSLAHVNVLEIGGWCMEIISLLELEGWHSPLSKRKCLRFRKFISRSAFPGLSNLLQGSPYLETLHINVEPGCVISPCVSYYTGENYLTCHGRSFQCLQSHLKTVWIAYCIEWDHDSELVQFLLDNSCVLEEIFITCGYQTAERSREVAEKQHLARLLSFRRASRNAVVLIPGSTPGMC